MLVNNFHTLVEALLEAPAHQPFVTMWNDDEDVETVTFGEFIHLAKLQASEFQARGLRSDETIILILPQGIALMAAFAGEMRLGAVPAILAYPNFKVEPAKYSSGLAGVSENLRARLVVVDEAFPAELSTHLVLRHGGKLLRGTIGS